MLTAGFGVVDVGCDGCVVAADASPVVMASVLVAVGPALSSVPSAPTGGSSDASPVGRPSCD